MNSNAILKSLLAKAELSRTWLAILNTVVYRIIPFNAAHRIKIHQMSADSVQTLIPYKRNNQNHLRGLHACCLATGAEFSTGLSLLRRIDPTKYRLIMQSMAIDYHFQAKLNSIANCELNMSWVEQNVLKPLESDDSVLVSVSAEVHDVEGNHLCTGNFQWQIKRWNTVKTTV